MEPLQIGAFIAFLAAFFAALWIFYDSTRQGRAATWPKTVATAMGVLTLPGVILAVAPGVILAVAPELLRGDGTTALVLNYLGLGAGGIAMVNLVFYALRTGSPPGWQPCPGCRRPVAPTWERCPDCGYSFVTIAGPQLEPEPPPPPPPTEPMPEPEPPGPVAPPVASPAKTQVLRSVPGHFAWLVVLNGPHMGHEFSLTDDMFIGRDGTRCQIALDDVTVSRLHARIRRQDEGFILHDLGSTSGTFVNGEQVFRHPLKDKDRVQLGRTELVFIEVREGAEATPNSALS